VDQRERLPDPAETIRMAMQYWQSRVWNALPCTVVNYPAASGLGPQLLDAQPCVNGRVLNSDGTFTKLVMPLIPDVPILWQGGGGVTATFPIAVGDECLVIFASRCIDQWFKNGFQPPNGDQPNPLMDPPELRMHNLSDGFALVGVRSLPNSFVPDTDSACIITDDLQTFFKLNPTAQSISIQANGGVTITAGNIVLNTPNGTVQLNGMTVDANQNVIAQGQILSNTEVVAKTVHLSTHKQSGVTTGGGQSGAPVPGT
jgi:hypothetical protein